jgi:hypothetical protein
MLFPNQTHMIFSNHSNLKNIGWTTGFFVLCVGLYLSLRTQAPLFEGHTMEWWLEETAKDWIQSGPHLSERQKKGVEAFRYFGKPGFEFLVNEMELARSPLSRFKLKMTRRLRQASWGKYLGFKERKKNIDRQAGFLLNHLSYPLEWTGIRLDRLHTTSIEEIIFSTVVLRNVTNHYAEVISAMGPLLNHTNTAIVSRAADTIASLYEHTDTVQELEPYLSGIPTIWNISSLKSILSKHVDQSTYAKDKLIGWSDRPASLETFFATMSLLSPTSTRNDATQKLERILISAANKEKPFTGPPLIFVPPEQPPNPSLLQYLVFLEAVDPPLDEMQPVMLEIADTMQTPHTTFLIARLHRSQPWDNTEMINRLMKFLTVPKDWNAESFKAFLTILLLEHEHPKAWDWFNQAIEKSHSKTEFLNNLQIVKESPEPYLKLFSSLYERLDYRPYWDIGETVLQHLQEMGFKKEPITNKQ